MPGFDRSGPMGAGPLTGGGRGLCGNAGYGTPFFGKYGFGGRMGYGRGFRGGYGPGMRRGFGARNQPGFGPSYMQDPAAEIDMLKTQAGSIKSTLDAINRRISDLEKSIEKPSGPGESR